jgi:hypothetical protein
MKKKNVFTKQFSDEDIQQKSLLQKLSSKFKGKSLASPFAFQTRPKRKIMLPHHKFTGFMDLFQIHVKSIISWVHII